MWPDHYLSRALNYKRFWWTWTKLCNLCTDLLEVLSISTYSMDSSKAQMQGGKAKFKVIFKLRSEKCHPDLHLQLVSLTQTFLSSRPLSFLLSLCIPWGNISPSPPWQEVSVQTEWTHKDSRNVKTACFQFHIFKGIQPNKWYFHHNIKVQKWYVYVTLGIK